MPHPLCLASILCRTGRELLWAEIQLHPKANQSPKSLWVLSTRIAHTQIQRVHKLCQWSPNSLWFQIQSGLFCKRYEHHLIGISWLWWVLTELHSARSYEGLQSQPFLLAAPYMSKSYFWRSSNGLGSSWASAPGSLFYLHPAVSLGKGRLYSFYNGLKFSRGWC